MTTPIGPTQNEDLLFGLIRDLYQAMKRLSQHALVCKPAWSVLDRTWDAACRHDSVRFEESINDLDSLVHLHHIEMLDREAASQYLVTRNLIRCVQEIWPYHFQPH
mgnify:CR=1 FL=1